jgi:ribosomally synthesized peptide (two-chain TOMM family)
MSNHVEIERKIEMARNDNATSQRPQNMLDERRTSRRPATHEGHGEFSEEPARYGPDLDGRVDFGGTGEAPMTLTQAQWQGNDLVLSFLERPDAEPYTREDFIEATEHLHAWRSAWLRAIGLAWSDEALARQLCEDPYKFFLNYCEYKMPRTVDIVVMPDEESRWVPGMPDRHNWRWNLTRNVLILHLPRKPANESEGPIALAAYEAVGKTYPFSISC